MGILLGKTALITGGSRGLGRAIALKLAGEGAEILLHYNQNRAAAEAVAREIAGPCRLLQADIRSPQEIEAMIASLHGAPLDILVNNAGIWGQTPLGSAALDYVESMLDANVKGLFWTTQVALPLLREGATIINMSSTAARVGIAAGRSLYPATKAAVDSLTKSWALELAPRKIRVNAVAPGYVETDMTAAYLAKPDVIRGILERSPFGRLGNPEEVADLVLFLCSPASQWITGQSINISGGFVV
jgi:NAD(P)-dependent dehydrogenase (short-subunit alcohol dehydrogenase family)